MDRMKDQVAIFQFILMNGNSQMNQDRIPFCIIPFEQSIDACGSAVDHAKELAQIIQNIMRQDKIK